MSEAHVLPKYVSLEKQGNNVGPPRTRSHRSSRGCGCGCLRCCCCCISCFRCCICFLLIIIVLLVAILVGIYFLLEPRMPTYNIDNLNVTTFDIKNNKMLYSEIVAVVRAENPNKEIGLHYGDNSINLIYSDTQICSGQFLPFLQPAKNTTIIYVELKGQVDFDQEMQQQLMQDNKEGNIPLIMTVKVPIRLVIHDLFLLRKFVINVNCSMIIDHLQPNQKPNILKKEFTYAVHK